MVPHYTLILRILITSRIRPYRIGELGVYGHPPTVSRVQGIIVVVADINQCLSPLRNAPAFIVVCCVWVYDERRWSDHAGLFLWSGGWYFADLWCWLSWCYLLGDLVSKCSQCMGTLNISRRVLGQEMRLLPWWRLGKTLTLPLQRTWLKISCLGQKGIKRNCVGISREWIVREVRRGIRY